MESGILKIEIRNHHVYHVYDVVMSTGREEQSEFSVVNHFSRTHKSSRDGAGWHSDVGESSPSKRISIYSQTRFQKIL